MPDGSDYYLLCVYVPEQYTEQILSALFHAGAGQIGNYSHCAWRTGGKGQFKPCKDSIPFIGEQDKMTYVAEDKIEIICPLDKKKEIRDILLAVHPYEMPAYHFLKIEL